MKKLKKLGKILNRAEQKEIKGGTLSTSISIGDGAGRVTGKCCNNMYPDICSGCVENANTLSCTLGSHFVEC